MAIDVLCSKAVRTSLGNVALLGGGAVRAKLTGVAWRKVDDDDAPNRYRRRRGAVARPIRESARLVRRVPAPPALPCRQPLARRAGAHLADSYGERAGRGGARARRR